jgi:plastocyanin
MTLTTRATLRTRAAAAAAAVALVVLALATAGATDREKPDKAHTVTIKDLKYAPANIKIKAGETVLWINEDTRDHTVTSDDAKREDFRSDNLGNGDTFDHPFKKAGKFPYHCKYHPRMKGLVTVTD